MPELLFLANPVTLGRSAILSVEATELTEMLMRVVE